MFDKPRSSPSAGRVILTYGRSLIALVIARSLAQRGVEVIGCDDVDLTVLSFSKHVQETFTVAPWKTAPERFLDDLEVAVRDYAPRDDRPYVLMPVFAEGELIARHRARFEPTVKLAAPNWESIDLVHPKDHLARLADTAGLPAPKSWVVDSAEALAELAPRRRYPLIVKPSRGEGGRGVSMVESADAAIEKVQALGFAPPPLLQEVSPGEDYCVAALAHEGRLATMMAYRNLTKFPRKAGAGAIRETVDAEPFRAATEALLQASRWTGLAQLDFRWTGQPGDAPALIEVNPRFWAGLFHSIQTAVDFPWLLYLQTIGQPLDHIGQPHIGARTKTPGVWLLAAIEEVAATSGQSSAGGQAWRDIRARLSAGQWADLRKDLGQMSGVQSLGEIVARLRQALAQGRDAPSEFDQDDDPLVGLGALFVLSALVKHGKLPDEITYDAGADAGRPGRKAPRSARPTIGVTMPDQGETAAWMAMRLAVWLAGGRAVRLTARAPQDPHTVDGLILGGGSDVFPASFEGQPKPGYAYDLARGDMEASWLLASRRHDLPVLGVCRGAQMLNVLAGGGLHMDLAGFEGANLQPSPWQKLFARKIVAVNPSSRFAAICGQPRLAVNVIHQQAIDRLGAGLTVAARQTNGVIQVIEDRSRRFWIGVQHHPELMLYRAAHRRLFKGLVAAARARRRERAALAAGAQGDG
jgi:gamma-glutamyl-gamma-aminobutyrate hydrolase PuuD/predicted ATP-grasp superfamily ATP-dependent carboligase